MQKGKEVKRKMKRGSDQKEVKRKFIWAATHLEG